MRKTPERRSRIPGRKAWAAISSAVTQLESELGVRLLNQTTHTITLSDVGHAFFPLVHGVLQDLERAVASVALGSDRHRAPPVCNLLHRLCRGRDCTPSVTQY